MREGIGWEVGWSFGHLLLQEPGDKGIGERAGCVKWEVLTPLSPLGLAFIYLTIIIP